MSGDLETGRRYLERQYGDDRNLAARQSIYSYQRPWIDVDGESLDLAGLHGDEAVLDVGCGNGRYLATLQARDHRGLACGVDLSFGMLESARRDFGLGPLHWVTRRRCRSRRLVRRGARDAHAVPRARSRKGRCRDPPGRAARWCRAGAHQLRRAFRELDTLLLDCAAATVDASVVRSRSSLEHFKVEGGSPLLESAFTDVTLHMFSGELVIDDVEPVIAYARSLGSFVVESEVDREPVLVELRRRVAETIKTEGALRITTASGCFVCR